MKKATYPCWCDISCPECGKILKIFCFSSKDFKQHLHFCEDFPCLENYYTRKLPETSAKSTISRLISMRYYRNQRVKEYHESLREKSIAALEKELTEPDLKELKKEIRQLDQEYIRQLRLQKGIRDDQDHQDTEL